MTISGNSSAVLSSVVVTNRPTGRLRFVLKKTTGEGHVAGRILQQEWYVCECDTLGARTSDRYEWRDVPLEEE